MGSPKRCQSVPTYVSDLPTASAFALWVVLTTMTPGQDLMNQSSMPLSLRDEPDTAMPMLTVVHRAGGDPALFEAWIRPA